MRSPISISRRLTLSVAGIALAAVVVVALAALAGVLVATNTGGEGPLASATTSASPAPSALASATATAAPQPPAGPSLDAYRGLGSWVDIFDKRAWADPEGVVRDMASHGVRTIFIETGNSKSDSAIFDPAGQAAFITAAHARGMKVVAWYLPYLKDVDFDYARVAEAIRFTTADGQRFDSFALDIESDVVRPVSVRNRALDALSRKIRNLVGKSYALGGIIPASVGLAKESGYWNGFPYRAVARDYDVIVPMAYYTYHGDGAASARADILADVRLLRAQPGCKSVPVHLIGGLAEQSSPAEVAAFAVAARSSGCMGVSLYGWPGMTWAKWKAMERPAR